MNIAEIRSLMQATPFQPFVIHMSDGRAFQVRHPDFIATRPSALSVTVYEGDSAQRLNLLQIVSIETIEAAAE